MASENRSILEKPLVCDDCDDTELDFEFTVTDMIKIARIDTFTRNCDKIAFPPSGCEDPTEYTADNASSIH